MDKVENIEKNLKDNLESIDKFDQIFDITISALKSLKEEGDCLRTFKGKLENNIRQLENMNNTHGNSTVMPIIYKQELVLLASYFEAFLKDFFILICETRFLKLNHEK